MKRIYLDNGATTPLDPRVLKEVVFHLKNTFGNVGSIHKEGVIAKKTLDLCRQKVALCLGVKSSEIFFTSGGTESNNMAIFGVLNFIRPNFVNKKLHIVTTKVEHASVLNCFRELEKSGIEVTYVSVNEDGLVNLAEFKKSLRPETFLVSIQYANNEIGTIQPIREISKIIRDFRNQSLIGKNCFPIFHSDASQSPAYLDCSADRLGVDLMTLDGHKIYGPKGIGVLYKRKTVSILPIIFGGGQEEDIRSGTENVPLIAGFAKALEICVVERQRDFDRLSKMRDKAITEILKINPNKIVLNGGLKNRLPNNINISIKDVDTEFLTLKLDAKGIDVSTKSACIDSDEGSYVVWALGGEDWRSKSSLRISFGRFTEEVDYKKFIFELRSILKK